MANQFNDKLGYLGTWINAAKSQTVSATSTFEAFQPVLVNDLSLQYNAEIFRDTIKINEKGIWKVDFAGTFSDATNDDMELKIDTESQGLNTAPVKWNARGGNNWAISYSVILNILDTGSNLVLFIRNNTDTAEISLSHGILTLVKLY
tara:strand:- start:771 stop:1214 length:444 start_codon:yes stop_codon:yes gene_type:complete